MRFDIHHHHHGLEWIEAALRQLLRQGDQTVADLTRLTQEVTEISDASQAAITLLSNLAEQLREAAADPAAIAALADQLDASGTALAAAVVANTPAAPPSE